eukprot:COSAG02_NODE_2156_length_9643_cov_55.052761_15_plen_92_part_00
MVETAANLVFVCACPRTHGCLRTDPTWASANLGVYLCLNCSGVHRSLGTHITQVRSITMDAWFPDQIEVGPHSSETCATNLPYRQSQRAER